MENLRDESHSLVEMERLSVVPSGGYSGAFLSAVLEGKETLVTQQGRILVAIHGKDAAFMFGTMGLGQGRLGGEGVDQVFSRGRRACGMRFPSLSPLFKHHLEN